MFFVLHLLTIRYHHPEQPPVTAGSNSTPLAIQSSPDWRVRLALFCRNIWTGVAFYSLSVIFIIPTLVCVGIGKNAYTDNQNVGYEAVLGRGSK